MKPSRGIIRLLLREYSQITRPSDDYMIKATNLWIHQVVIRLGLCPWAAKDVQNTRIRVFWDDTKSKSLNQENKGNSGLFGWIRGLLDYKDIQINICSFAKEIAFESPQVNSAMAILPQFQNFTEFLEFTSEFEEVLKTTGLDAAIQVATFHPNYQFEDTNEDDAENWTNRSPFPTIHLLKVADVSAAIDAYPGSTDNIWERNIRVLRKIGTDSLIKKSKEILEEAERNDSLDKGSSSDLHSECDGGRSSVEELDVNKRVP